MSAAGGRDALSLACLFGLALALYVATAALAARAIGVPLAFLAGFFDGSLYLEIAKSFPLPFAPAARDYAGQGPAYPALIYLARLVAPASVHWGWLALAASWLPAAACAVVFGLVCRELGVPPFWPGLVFASANPRWLWVAATAHPEPLAMLCALASALAWLRHRLAAAVAWLALAGLARFPALLLGAALAFGVLGLRRDWRPRSFLLLAVPPAAFALLNLYLAWRIPGFAGVTDAHGVFLDTHLTWPLWTLAAHALPWLRGEGEVPDYGMAYLALTWASLAVYAAAALVGLRSGDGTQRFLAVWVVSIAGFHASLAGEWAGFDFMRLALLAWPAALLILWRRFAPALPTPARTAACLAAGLLSAACAVDWVARAARWQGSSYPWPTHAIRGFRLDEPRWIDYRHRFDPPTAPGRAGAAP